MDKNMVSEYGNLYMNQNEMIRTDSISAGENSYNIPLHGEKGLCKEWVGSNSHGLADYSHYSYDGVREEKIDERSEQATDRFEVVYHWRYNESPVVIDGFGRVYDRDGNVDRDEEGHAFHFNREGLGTREITDRIVSLNVLDPARPLTPDHEKESTPRGMDHEFSEERSLAPGTVMSIDREFSVKERGVIASDGDKSVFIPLYGTDEVAYKDVPLGYGYYTYDRISGIDEKSINEESVRATERFEIHYRDKFIPDIVDGYGRMFTNNGDVIRNGGALHFNSDIRRIDRDAGRDVDRIDFIKFKEYAPPLGPDHKREDPEHREDRMYHEFVRDMGKIDNGTPLKIDYVETARCGIYTDTEHSFSIRMPSEDGTVRERSIDERELAATARYLVDLGDGKQISVDGFGRIHGEDDRVLRDDNNHAYHFLNVPEIKELAEHMELNITTDGYAPPFNQAHGINKELEPNTTLNIDVELSNSIGVITDSERSFAIPMHANDDRSYEIFDDKIGDSYYQTFREGVDISKIDHDSLESAARYEINCPDMYAPVIIDGYGMMYEDNGKDTLYTWANGDADHYHFSAFVPKTSDSRVSDGIRDCGDFTVTFKGYMPNHEHETDRDVEIEYDADRGSDSGHEHDMPEL